MTNKIFHHTSHTKGGFDLSEPTDQDRRIASLKQSLKSLMGSDKFRDFYITTPFNSDDLEKVLVLKLKMVESYHQPMDADEAQERGILPADETHIRQITDSADGDECTCGSNPDAPACSHCRANPVGDMPF